MRRFIEREINQVNHNFSKSSVRVIDDFIFLIIILSEVGLMGFDIKNGLDTLLYVYKRTLPF
jgi:5'-3' exonuclease